MRTQARRVPLLASAGGCDLDSLWRGPHLQSRWLSNTALCAFALLGPRLVSAQPTISGLGTLGGPVSVGTAISADGSTVTGYSFTTPDFSRTHAFRWTTESGMQDLGTFTGDSRGLGVAANGLVVVGSSDSQGLVRGFRWTSPTGLQNLGTLGGGTCFAYAINADGSIVTGESEAVGAYRAFRWTIGGGMQDIGTLNGRRDSFGWAINSDGSVIAGESVSATRDDARAFRWTSKDGMQNLGTLGGAQSFARSISANGSAIFGYSNVNPAVDQAWHVFVWTAAEGMRDLGYIPGATDRGPAISGDGVVFVGPAATYIWTAATGAVSLTDYLANQGLDLRSGSSWQLLSANAVSGDGSAITGHGIFNGQQQAYIIRGIQVACAPPYISTQPVAVFTCPTGVAGFSAAAIGTGPLTYQWQWRPINGQFTNLIDGVNIDPAGGPIHVTAQGARTGTVAIEITGGSGAAQSHWEQRCIVTNACGSVMSNPSTLTICQADLTCDGGVDVNDLLYFLGHFESGASQADLDNGSGTGTPDGGVDINDLLFFLEQFELGC